MRREAAIVSTAILMLVLSLAASHVYSELQSFSTPPNTFLP
ncbi:hypothetical protein [Thermococcus atlanticus]